MQICVEFDIFMSHKIQMLSKYCFLQHVSTSELISTKDGNTHQITIKMAFTELA